MQAVQKSNGYRRVTIVGNRNPELARKTFQLFSENIHNGFTIAVIENLETFPAYTTRNARTDDFAQRLFCSEPPRDRRHGIFFTAAVVDLGRTEKPFQESLAITGKDLLDPLKLHDIDTNLHTVHEKAMVMDRSRATTLWVSSPTEI